MLSSTDRLSLGTLLKSYWLRISITWVLTLTETVIFSLLPLLIGWSIDGLLADDTTTFTQLIFVLILYIVLAVGRRVYDTRTYSAIRLDLGNAQAERSATVTVSVSNAQLIMGRELVDFLEKVAPMTMTVLVQSSIAIYILGSFHQALTLSTGGAVLVSVATFMFFSRRFFNLNTQLNNVAERQVTVLESKNPTNISTYFTSLRRAEIRMSDTESFVYGFILLAPLSMLAFNLWFGATQIDASPGKIFSIVSYSLEFVQASVALPFVLQSLTRLSEITQRINPSASDGTDNP